MDISYDQTAVNYSFFSVKRCLKWTKINNVMVWFIVCERHLKHFHHKMHVNIPKNTGTGYEQTAVNYKLLLWNWPPLKNFPFRDSIGRRLKSNHVFQEGRFIIPRYVGREMWGILYTGFSPQDHWEIKVNFSAPVLGDLSCSSLPWKLSW